DTSSNVLGSMLIRLSENPHILARLQADLDTLPFDERGFISNPNLTTLSYLSAVLKETMRIDPSVSGFSRQLDSDTVIGGYFLPKKTKVLVSISSLHRGTRWADPDVFDPERFMNGAGESDDRDGAWAPFSMGSRNCIGKA
ncbi:cytochrome P450, partial [Blyttiomyces helicus]